MLGEKIGEFEGKVTGQRVLPSDGAAPKMETTAEFSGPLVGVQSNTTATYWASLRPDGSLFGEGQAIIMTVDGDVATFRGTGVWRLW